MLTRRNGITKWAIIYILIFNRHPWCIVMAQNLSCRYQEAFNEEDSQQFQEYEHSTDPNPAGG